MHEASKNFSKTGYVLTCNQIYLRREKKHLKSAIRHEKWRLFPRNGTVKNVNSGKISFLSKPGHFPRPYQLCFLYIYISFKMLRCCPKNTQVIVDRVAKILSKCGQNNETGSSNASHWTTRLTRQRLWPLAVHVFWQKSLVAREHWGGFCHFACLLNCRVLVFFSLSLSCWKVCLQAAVRLGVVLTAA